MHLSLPYSILTEIAYRFHIFPAEKMCWWFSIVDFFDHSAAGIWRSCVKAITVS